MGIIWPTGKLSQGFEKLNVLDAYKFIGDLDIYDLEGMVPLRSAMFLGLYPNHPCSILWDDSYIISQVLSLGRILKTKQNKQETSEHTGKNKGTSVFQRSYVVTET